MAAVRDAAANSDERTVQVPTPKPEININMYYLLDAKEAERILYHLPSSREFSVYIGPNSDQRYPWRMAKQISFLSVRLLRGLIGNWCNTCPGFLRLSTAVIIGVIIVVVWRLYRAGIAVAVAIISRSGVAIIDRADRIEDHYEVVDTRCDTYPCPGAYQCRTHPSHQAGYEQPEDHKPACPTQHRTCFRYRTIMSTICNQENFARSLISSLLLFLF